MKYLSFHFFIKGSFSMNKIFFINPMSYNNLSLYDYSILKNISNDIEVVYFCSKNNELLKNLNNKKNIKIKKIFKYHNKILMLKIFSYFFSLIKLFYYVFKFKPKIIHFQWFKIPFIDLLFLIKIKIIKPRIKIILTVHNLLPHDTSMNIFYNIIYKLIDYKIFHSNKTKIQYIKNFNVKKINKINSLFIVEHPMLNLRNLIYNQNQFNKTYTKLFYELKKENVFIFSVLGFISYYKGVDLIIESWKKSKILYNNPNVLLIIAGKPSYNIEVIKDTNIIYDLEFITNEKYLSYLKLTDVLLLPYREISQSGVLAAAINEKIPVLVSNAGGLNEILSYGKVGWSVPKNNQHKLQLKMEKIFQHKLNKFISQHSWKVIQEKYSEIKISNKTQKIYKSLLK